VRQILVLVLVVLFASGCALDALVAGAGSGAAGRAKQGLEAVEQASVVAGQGAGRIPATQSQCPQDYELAISVTRSTAGWSSLTVDEQAAFQVLVRSAATCGHITADPEYLNWKKR
jgi:hypothetical protein